MKDGRRRPIIIITSRSVDHYDSIAEASAATGISRQRIIRALASPYGEIAHTRPVVCVDEDLDEDF